MAIGRSFFYKSPDDETHIVFYRRWGHFYTKNSEIIRMTIIVPSNTVCTRSTSRDYRRKGLGAVKSVKLIKTQTFHHKPIPNDNLLMNEAEQWDVSYDQKCSPGENFHQICHLLAWQCWGNGTR